MKRTALTTTAAIVIAALVLSVLAAPVAFGAVRNGEAQFAPYTASAAHRVAAIARLRAARAAARRTVKVAAPAPTTDAARVQVLLAGLVNKYPILAGTTVEMGDAMGYQAVCFYRSGRIVVSPSHTATLERILNHEVWHVIDWRDNGTIDWGESLPPATAAAYAAS